MIDPRLLIPLSALPGLDPVGLRDEDGRLILSGVGDAAGQVPTLISVAEHHGSVLWRRVSIGLGDPATRDRVLRWLAARVGLPVGCGAPAWWRWTPDGGGWALADGTPFGVDRAVVYPWRADAIAVTDVGEQRWVTGTGVSNLDPTDDTRLTDGSRLVDALALAAVLRQVGGAQ